MVSEKISQQRADDGWVSEGVNSESPLQMEGIFSWIPLMCDSLHYNIICQYLNESSCYRRHNKDKNCTPLSDFMFIYRVSTMGRRYIFCIKYMFEEQGSSANFVPLQFFMCRVV